MRPVTFPESTHVLAKDQQEYLPLPVHRQRDGLVVSCWRLTWRERLKLFLTGRLWLMTLTYNAPLQPLAPQVDSPFSSPKGDRT